MFLDKLSIHSFLNNNGIKTESGQKLDFHTHRYLYDIYSDNSKYLCCTKAGQIGFSTMAILKTIWLAKNRHFNIGYILPTVEMVEKFVGSKVNRIAQQNPVIQQWMKDKDKVTEKQIDDAYIFYLGSQTDKSAIMLSLDMLVGDEYDKSPQGVMETYDSRLQHSQHGYKWVFSNPTIPDFGVDRFMQLSDYKKWHIHHSCGKTVLFDESCIDYKREKYICPHCGNEITEEENIYGDWYDRKGNKWNGKIQTEDEWSGWWIPLWLNPMMSASKIAEYKRTKTAEYFANFVCGLPYISIANQVTQKALENCLSEKINDQSGRIILGMDTGHNIHYSLINSQGFFFHGYCNSVAENEASENPIKNYDPYNEIEDLLIKFPRLMIVADQGGDLIGIRKLQANYPGRVYLCWFTKETKSQELARWIDEENGKAVFKILADRNRQIQLLVDEIYEQRAIFNGTKEEWQPYFEHWKNIYRVKEIKGDENDPQYGWRWVWKRKGADHWALSSVYARIGYEHFGSELATVIKKDNFMSGVPMGSNVNGGISAKQVMRKFNSFNSNSGENVEYI